MWITMGRNTNYNGILLENQIQLMYRRKGFKSLVIASSYSNIIISCLLMSQTRFSLQHVGFEMTADFQIQSVNEVRLRV